MKTEFFSILKRRSKQRMYWRMLLIDAFVSNYTVISILNIIFKDIIK